MLLKFVNGSCLKSPRQIFDPKLIMLNIAQCGQKMAFVQVIFIENLWAEIALILAVESKQKMRKFRPEIGARSSYP